METIDDTGFGNIRLIQDTEGFRYGIDAVLLADFAQRCCPSSQKAVELGCGNGIVSLLLAHFNQSRQITGIEFQEHAAQLAARSSELNGLSERVSFVCEDVSLLKQNYPELGHTADMVVSNPPYIAKGSGIPGEKQSKLSARQETTAGIEDFIGTASWLLQEKGSLCLVHRPFRLVDIFYYCRTYRLEPKRIRFVHPREGEAPNIVLMRCVLGGGRELIYDPPLYVYGQDGEYSPEVLEIYGRDANK